jgi:hypothetical protein
LRETERERQRDRERERGREREIMPKTLQVKNKLLIFLKNKSPPEKNTAKTSSPFLLFSALYAEGPMATKKITE